MNELGGPEIGDVAPQEPFESVRDRLLAGKAPVIEGHYNVAYRVMWRGVPALLRRHKDVERDFDPRMMSEPQALRAAAEAGVRVPRLLHLGVDYLVIEFIEQRPSDVLDDAWLRWYPDLLRQILALHARPRSSATVRNVLEWQRWLWGFHDSLFTSVAQQYGDRLAKIGLPSLKEWWPYDRVIADEESCPFVTLLHADLHPDNLLTDGSRVWVLDWELALVGDPVWDAATSLHRTHWRNAQDEHVAEQLWLAALVAGGQKGAERRLRSYRSLEIWKSLLVDSVRYPRAFAGGETLVVASFVAKLQQATQFLPVPARTADEVEQLFSTWGEV